MTLPQVLLLLAVLVFVFGVTQLSTSAARPQASTKRALIVWLILFAGSSLVWFLSIRGE